MGNSPKARAILIENYLDMIRLTGDIGEALQSTGRSYDSWKRTLKQMGMDKELEDLVQWKLDDAERLTYALGTQWQRGKASGRRS